MTPTLPTSEFASLVYGAGGVAADDPAEALHEASRLYPRVTPRGLVTALAMAATPEFQQTLDRASRLHPQRPSVDLADVPYPSARFRDLLHRRASRLPAARAPIALDRVAAVLRASYGAALWRAGVHRRPVPSAGALYPLELYVLPLDVSGLDRAAYHYAPFRHRLERLADLDERAVVAASVDPAVVERASALVVVTAVFWRSRFKYGVRGYRFALLEAGHLAQNLVLAAAALRLSALPLGGFYDRSLDALVAADGLDEACVHAVLLGGPA